MKVIIKISQAELDSMQIDSVKLQQYVLEKVDSISVKKQKIIHQTELEVQLEIVKD